MRYAVCTRDGCDDPLNQPKGRGRPKKYCSTTCQRLDKESCSVDGCTKPQQAKGLCRNHYKSQWYKDTKPEPVIKMCDFCGLKQVPLGSSKFCSKACYKESHKLSARKDQHAGECKRCEKPFVSAVGHQEFCSAKCRRKWNSARRTTKKRLPVVILCVICSSEFDAVHRNQKYCSEDCRKTAERNRRTVKARKLVRPPKGMSAIYYLRDKSTQSVVYIGVTKDAFSNRLAKHKSSHRPVKALAPYLDNLVIEPVIFVPEDKADEWESLAIEAAWANNWPIVNIKIKIKNPNFTRP